MLLVSDILVAGLGARMGSDVVDVAALAALATSSEARFWRAAEVAAEGAVDVEGPGPLAARFELARRATGRTRGVADDEEMGEVGSSCGSCDGVVVNVDSLGAFGDAVGTELR